MARFTRRQFLATGALAGGGLALGTVLLHRKDLGDARELVVDGPDVLLNTWVKLAPDGTATVFVPHSEMGQGVLTSLPMMLADEMDLAWEQVRVEQAPAGLPFANRGLTRGYLLGDWEVPAALVGAVDLASMKVAELMHLQLTGGSTSVRLTGQYGMRRAGAAARAVLIEAAARRWQVDAERCDARDGRVVHAASDRSLPYAELAEEAARLDAPRKPVLKSPDRYRIVGTSVPRVDLPEKVDGSAVYGIDVSPPGLRHAAIAPAPSFGGTVAAFDGSATLALPGVEQVVPIDGAVAVVADRYWRARAGVEALKVDFEPGANGDASSESLRASQEAALGRDDLETDIEAGDFDAAWSASDRVVEQKYAVPYLAHATMEPMNCTAWVHDGGCEVWSGVQNMLTARAVVAEVSGLPFEKVTVHPLLLGGGFGRRGSSTMDYVRQAVQIAAQVPHPVKLVWTREDDMRHDAYRPAQVSHLRAAFDADGRPAAWQQDYVGKHEPQEATVIPYAIANQRVRYAPDETPVPFGPWRSVDHSQHAFFIESFVDELAEEAGEDPLAFRLGLLEDKPRHRRLLEQVADRSGWGQPLAAGHGRGIALVESFGSIVAEVVELIVEGDDVAVQRVVVAADTGEVIHPDALHGQLESGVIFGLTAALYGEITIQDGAVVEGNFPEYEMVRMATAPEIETILSPTEGAPLGGVGEIATPPVAPALANAIFQATGRRIRELPVRKGMRVVARRALPADRRPRAGGREELPGRST